MDAVWLFFGVLLVALSATPGARALRFAGDGTWRAAGFEIVRGILAIAAGIACILIATGRLA